MLTLLSVVTLQASDVCVVNLECSPYELSCHFKVQNCPNIASKLLPIKNIEEIYQAMNVFDYELFGTFFRGGTDMIFVPKGSLQNRSSRYCLVKNEVGGQGRSFELSCTDRPYAVTSIKPQDKGLLDDYMRTESMEFLLDLKQDKMLYQAIQ